jgi:hypothetical protein
LCVIPAKAGIQCFYIATILWTPGAIPFMVRYLTTSGIPNR